MNGSTASQNALGELVGMMGCWGRVKSIPLTVREMYLPVVEHLRLLDPRAAWTRMVSFACVAIRRLCADQRVVRQHSAVGRYDAPGEPRCDGALILRPSAIGTSDYSVSRETCRAVGQRFSLPDFSTKVHGPGLILGSYRPTTRHLAACSTCQRQTRSGTDHGS